MQPTTNYKPSTINHQPVFWGLLHGLNDFAAGFMLANYTLAHNYSQSFILIVVYSIIGFGGQLPVGFWVDYKKQLRPFALISILSLLAALLVYLLTGIRPLFYRVWHLHLYM